ncbi:hypothetical protein K503DRAFT_85354 [Rhizopogon vinicolor AM-OR11-026]|uniref:Uncharacterized protein n=1 Tax=Rhizopogon vinicolor AM-OR11-026 TaxID=1314800 RepID=A0A1B7MFR0_9AGAM|nr:hypothetical protein K503DRAFT_85354 [Rhizopogon vinicolor AM-OR11-026]
MQRPSFGHGLCCTSALSFYHGRICPGFSASILDRSGGVITGSCAIKMLLGVDSTIQSRDLNLIVPYGGFETMDAFILRILFFESIPGVVHPALSPLINRYHAYLHQGRIVTLTEVKKDKDVLHVILSGASTSDMIFMTGGGLTSFFPDLTVRGLTVLTHVGGLVRVDAGEKLGSIVRGSSSRFIIENDTSFLVGPCGNLCPILWHHITLDRAGYITVDWDIDHSVKNVLYGSDIEWWLNDYCLKRIEPITNCERETCHAPNRPGRRKNVEETYEHSTDKS